MRMIIIVFKLLLPEGSQRWTKPDHPHPVPISWHHCCTHLWYGRDHGAALLPPREREAHDSSFFVESDLARPSPLLGRPSFCICCAWGAALQQGKRHQPSRHRLDLDIVIVFVFVLVVAVATPTAAIKTPYPAEEEETPCRVNLSKIRRQGNYKPNSRRSRQQ